MTNTTYGYVFGKVTASEHSFVVHDVRETQLFAHGAVKEKNNLSTTMTRICFQRIDEAYSARLRRRRANVFRFVKFTLNI